VRDGLQRVTDDLTVDDAGSAESVAKELEGVRLMISGHTARLRSEHQAFILTPLFKYLRRRPWSRRYRAAAP